MEVCRWLVCGCQNRLVFLYVKLFMRVKRRSFIFMLLPVALLQNIFLYWFFKLVRLWADLLSSKFFIKMASLVLKITESRTEGSATLFKVISKVILWLYPLIWIYFKSKLRMDATLFLHYLICVIRTDLCLLEVLLLHPLLPFIKFFQVSQPLLLLPLFRNSRP